MGLSEDFSKAFAGAGKTLLAEKKQRERDAVRYGRRMRSWPSERETTLKEAVSAVLEEAVAAATGNGQYAVSARTLYYQVRPLAQAHTDKDLEYGYFSQTLLVSYQKENGPIAGLYREPRGSLREPHTGVELLLGTLEVADYSLPEYVFDKILYVEKVGLDPIWEAARLAERYDLAIASGNGQPVEAIRALFERAEAGEYQLFVLHDADPAGYSIARTIAEETKRMPDYSVEVVDLGLSVDDAIAAGLPTEIFTRRKALPWWMRGRLNKVESEWFGGEHSYAMQWKCTRVELNAFTAPDLVAYVEAGLQANGAGEKMVIPEDVVTETAEQAHRGAVKAWVAKQMAEMFDTESIVDTLVDETADRVVDGPAGWIAEAYDEDRGTYWRDAIDKRVDQHIEAVDTELRPRLRELLRELEDDEDGD